MENRIKILNGGSGEERRYQIDLTEVELGLMSDLLNSVSDWRAAPLRQAFNQEVRASHSFVLRLDKNIVRCERCKGTGSIKLMDEYYDYKEHTCNICRGEGRLIIVTSIRQELVTDEWKRELTPAR